MKKRTNKKKALRSTLQRKTNQFIMEMNAQQAEDEGEENSKFIQERLLKKNLVQKFRERKTRKERK